jgi:hypothetical protein
MRASTRLWMDAGTASCRRVRRRVSRRRNLRRGSRPRPVAADRDRWLRMAFHGNSHATLRRAGRPRREPAFSAPSVQLSKVSFAQCRSAPVKHLPEVALWKPHNSACRTAMIAERADCSRTSVYQAIRALERLGILSLPSGRQRGSRTVRLRCYGPAGFPARFLTGT